MRSARLIAGTVALAAAGVLAVSVAVMARRVTAYHGRAGVTLPVFSRINQREFDFRGIPVSIADERDARGEMVVVRFGERELRLQPGAPVLDPQVPGLARHASWLAVLRMVEQGRVGPLELGENLARDEADDRLVIVARDARRSLDGTAHGLGRPADWTFDLHELLRDGSIRTERYGFPLSRREVAAGARPVGGVPPLEEGTWQYFAALMTIPLGARPTPAFTRDAVSAMGWTLPSGALAGLALTWAIAALAAPRRREPAP